MNDFGLFMLQWPRRVMKQEVHLHSNSVRGLKIHNASSLLININLSLAKIFIHVMLRCLVCSLSPKTDTSLSLHSFSPPVFPCWLFNVDELHHFTYQGIVNNKKSNQYALKLFFFLFSFSFAWGPFLFLIEKLNDLQQATWAQARSTVKFQTLFFFFFSWKYIYLLFFPTFHFLFMYVKRNASRQ